MRILVTGSDGLVGQALRRVETRHERVFLSRHAPDLLLGHQVDSCFLNRGPFDLVVHCAAFVGGIGQQSQAPYDLCHKNLLMACNVVDACVRHKAKLLAFSSVCAMPDPSPLNPVCKEEWMHDGPPPEENWHYGHAKRMIDVLINGAAKQHGLKGCTLIPANIFGPHDNYRLGTCHVVPALIHKLYLARKSGVPLRVWGDGSSEREFVSTDDVARIVMRLADLRDQPPRLIVSSGEAISIKQLVWSLEKATRSGLEPYRVEWQTDKPNGQRRRPTDTSLLQSLLPDFRFEPLGGALKRSYDWFAANYETCRR